MAPEQATLDPKKVDEFLGKAISDVAATLHLKLYDDKISPEENEAQGRAFRATHDAHRRVGPEPHRELRVGERAGEPRELRLPGLRFPPRRRRFIR